MAGGERYGSPATKILELMMDEDDRLFAEADVVGERMDGACRWGCG